MHRINLFAWYGWMLFLMGLFYAYSIRKQYGFKLPHSTEEWLAEIFVGMLMIPGIVMICVGRYLGRGKE